MQTRPERRTRTRLQTRTRRTRTSARNAPTALVLDAAARNVRPLLSTARLRALALHTLRALPQRARHVELSVAFITASSMARYNRQYRHRNGPTDVLSFRLDEGHSATLLGQVLLCPAVVRRRAREAGESVRRYAARLVIHGFLHLAGYDHEHDRDCAAMDRLERRILHVVS